MRIGLTGASGVLGRLLIDEFSRLGHAVDGFAGDVRDTDDVRDWAAGFDIVVHAAAVVPVQTVNQKLDEAIAVNVGGTANVAKAVSEAGHCRMVYLSTSHVYAPKSSPLSENDPTGPSSLYGMTKLQGEDWVRLFVASHLIIRIFSFFDRRQEPAFLFPALCRRIRDADRNACLDIVDAFGERDIADSGWVARVCAELVAGGHSGTVNCGTGQGHTVLHIAETLAATLGRNDLTWEPAAGGSGDKIVADVTRMNEWLGALPDFDLASAFADHVGGRERERRVG